MFPHLQQTDSDSQYLHVCYHTLRPAHNTPARCVSAQTHSRLQLSWHTAGRSPATAAAHLQEPRVKLQYDRNIWNNVQETPESGSGAAWLKTGGDKQEVINIRRVIQIFIGRATEEEEEALSRCFRRWKPWMWVLNEKRRWAVSQLGRKLTHVVNHMTFRLIADLSNRAATQWALIGQQLHTVRSLANQISSCCCSTGGTWVEPLICKMCTFISHDHLLIKHWFLWWLRFLN